MELKDLTEEQAKEIALLLYPFPDLIKSELDCKFQPYDETWLDDAAEYYRIYFDGVIFADKIYRIRIWIYPSLDCEIDYYDKNSKQHGGRLPVRNQYKIQELFIKWNLKPIFNN